jgi:non-specific serine/threonine protein kinase
MFDPHRLTGDNSREQRQWTQRALALSGGSPANRVKALTSAAWLAFAHYDFDQGRLLAAEALTLARDHDDQLGAATVSFVRGHAAFCEGDLAVARRYLLDALAGFRALDARGRAAWALCYLASLDSGAALDEGGDPADLARAIGYYEAALAVFREVGHQRGEARALHGLAYVAYKQRDLPQALATTQEVLALDWAHRWQVYHYLEDIADIAGRIGRPVIAARLYGAAEAQREDFGRPVEPVFLAEFEQDVAVARRALGEAAFAVAWAAGRGLPPEQAVAVALDPSLRAAAGAARPGSVGSAIAPGSPLTARQAQILPLLAEGKTDREIAAALYLSHRTVEHHVDRLAARLGVRSRAAIVGAAHAAGLLAARPPSSAE